ncbi:acyltransferase family protein [Kluyvera intermedia]|jgi:fucose 4-O-acetylase-like acetyltransferase|uniref:acyltransferase family protein n=1 Tax=Kluyvera intermedia TaxID=61648 RepID=UPI003B9F9F8E
MKTEHLDYIDTAKGIGIILVLIGHIFPRESVDFIYLFHMPLFFFISGYLLSPKAPDYFTIKKLKSLIVPYVSFLFFILLLNTFISLALEHITVMETIKLYIKAIYGGALLKGDFGAYWFVTTLFISIVALNFLITKLRRKTIILVLLIMYGLSFINQYYFKDIVFPLGINICLQSIPLMYVGYYSRCNPNFLKMLSAIGTFSLIIFLIYHYSSMRVDFKSTQYGLPVINTLLSIMMIFITFILSKMLKNNSTLKFIGSASITIMFTHQWFHFNLIKLGINNYYAITLMTLVLSLVCHLLLTKWPTGSFLFLGKGKQSQNSL